MKRETLIECLITLIVFLLLIITIIVVLHELSPENLYTQVCEDYGADYVFVECFDSPLASCIDEKKGHLCEYSNGTQFEVKIPMEAVA